MLSLKQGWHYLLRHRAHSLYLILLIALLFASILLLLAQYWSSQFVKPVDNFDRIVHARFHQPITQDHYQYYKQRQKSFEMMSRMGAAVFLMQDNRSIDVQRVDPDFFQLFLPQLKEGRLLVSTDSELQAPFRFIVSEEFLERQFPGEQPARLELQHGPADIIGVVEKDFYFPVQSRIWMAIQDLPEDYRYLPNTSEFVGRLNTGTTAIMAEQELRQLLKDYVEQAGGSESDVSLMSFAQHSRGGFDFDIRMLGIIFVVVAISGVISIANMVGLDLLKRDREWRIRHLLGIAPETILKTPLASFLFMLLAGLLSGYILYRVLSEIFSPYAMVNAPNAPFWWSLSLTPVQLAVVILVFSTVVTLVAFFPTWLLLLRRAVARTAVRAGRNRGVKAYFFRWTLLAVQAAAAIVLLQLMVMLCVLFYHEALADRGFKRNQLMVSAFANAHHPVDKDTIASELRARIADVSTGLAISNAIPGSIAPKIALMESPDAVSSSGAMELFQVSADYFSVMNIQLLEGRYFNEQDRTDSSGVFLVDAGAANKLWPEESAIGQTIILFPDIAFLRQQGTVVGVVSAVRSNPHQLPVFYQPLAQGKAGVEELQVISAANNLRPLQERLASLSTTDEGFANAQTIERVLAKSGEMTLNRILNFLPACLLIVFMLLVSIRNTTLRILEDYRKPLAIYQVAGWQPMAIIHRLSLPLYLSLAVALLVALAVSLQLDTRFWFDWLLNQSHLEYYVLAVSCVTVLLLAWLSFWIPCWRLLQEKVSVLLRS